MHVCIAVPNLETALGFYRDVLGFTSVFQTENANADGNLLGFDTDVVNLRAHHLSIGVRHEHTTEINLVEFVAPATTSGPAAAQNVQGLTRLALLVEDLDEACGRISSHDGVEMVCAPREIVIRDADAVHSSRWFSFLDPFGVFITVTESP